MIQEPCMSSGSLTVATVVVCGAPALLYGVVVHPAAADSTVTIYDNATTNSGTILAVVTAKASQVNPGTLLFSIPVIALKGVVAVVAGSGATSEVYFTRAS